MANLAYYVGIAICVMTSVTVIATFATLVPKDSAQNSKLLAIISVFSIATAVVAYGLALYHFSNNPTYMMHFMMAMIMLIALPASLIATSVSAITVSNLRDTLAAAASA